MWRLAPLFCLAVFVSACAPVRQRAPTSAPHALILISIDGYRADYIERGLSPTLRRLADDGVLADAMKPAFPTLTFPNHYTLVTGLYPDHHGIVNNRMVNPVTGAVFLYKDSASIADPAWWGGEPVWVSVEKHGEHAATMFWPGSDVAIDGVRPSEWRRFDGKITPDARVDQVLAWMDQPPATRPVFYTLYFDQVDHAGHDGGPDSPAVDTALREVDGALARLIAGLKRRGVFERTDIVVVSDHGMAKTSRDRAIYLDDLIPIDDVNVVNLGLLAGVNPLAGDTAAVEKPLLAHHDHMRCWRKSEVPARLHYGGNPRIPALLCLADDGWIIRTHAHDGQDSFFPAGDHGYDNDDPNMRALFVAHGPAFERGKVVPEFDNVDVYPLLMHVLGLKPRPNDGDFATVAPMLRDDGAR